MQVQTLLRDTLDPSPGGLTAGSPRRALFRAGRSRSDAGHGLHAAGQSDWAIWHL